MELYREGFLNKAGKGIFQAHLQSWKPRYFVLEGSSLKYYKCKEILPENMLGCIALCEIDSVTYMKGEKHNFQITTKSPKSRTYYMSGKSEDEVSGWIRVIEMAKAKWEKKNDSENPPATEFGVYDEVSPPTQSLMTPQKPKRTEVPSEYSLIGPQTSPTRAQSQKSASLPNTATPSDYESVGSLCLDEKSLAKDENDDDDSLEEDPTYDMVKPKPLIEASKKPDVDDERDLDPDLYDTVPDVGMPTVSEPPPLPNREPSLSNHSVVETALVVESSVTEANLENGIDPMGFYDEVRFPPAEGEVNKEGQKEQKGVVSQAQEKTPSTLPIYAKPMRKKNSKRVLNPAMIDIGEVSIDVEQESAGGKEVLEKGMIKPIGERFAVDELKALLQKYEEANNNNNGNSEEKVVDFDMNQCETAFDLLRSFLQKYQ